MDETEDSVERRLVAVFAGLSLVLAVALAGTLTVVTGLAPVSTALAQGLGGGFGGGCARAGLNLSSMPCVTGLSGASGSAFTRTGIQVTGDTLKDAEAAGRAYYAQEYGGSDVTVKATDYGCRVQVDVTQGGSIVKSLAYDRAGGIAELY